MSTLIPSPLPNATPSTRGAMSAADKSKLDGYPASPSTPAVTAVTEGNGLALTTGTLSMGAASDVAPGAVTTGAQEFAGAKTLSGAILNGVSTITEAVASLVRAAAASLVLRSSLGAGASDVCVKVGTSVADGSVNATAKLQAWVTGSGGTEVEKASINKAGALTCGGVFANGTVVGGSFSCTGIAVGATGVGVPASSSVASFSSGWALADIPTTEAFRFLSTTPYANLEASIVTFRNSNVYTTDPVVRLRTSGRIDQSGTDSSASPGAATINKPTGKSAVANGASSVVITNSTCAVASRVMVTFHADPGSRYWVVPGAGSFTVNLSSAATADVAFSWEVSNII